MLIIYLFFKNVNMIYKINTDISHDISVFLCFYSSFADFLRIALASDAVILSSLL